MNTSEISTCLEKIENKFDLFSFLDSIDLGAYIVTRDKEILYWNKEAERLTGYTLEKIRGRRCADNILNHIDRNGVEICRTDFCPLHCTLKSGCTTKVAFALYAQTSSGTRMPVDIFAVPLKIGDDFIGAIEFFGETDIKHRDLEKAMQIQKAMIPKILPPNIEISYHPAEVVGGDLIFYQHPWIAMVDVSGHGIGAALVSTSLRIILSEFLTPDMKPEELSDLLEHRFGSLELDEIFFTGIFCKFESAHRLLIKSFGHPKPLIVSGNGIDFLPVPGDAIIGFFMPHNNDYLDITLKPDEKIFIYSDGLVDVDTKYGSINDKFFDLIKDAKSLKEIYIGAQNQNIRSYQSDDISMIMISSSK